MSVQAVPYAYEEESASLAEVPAPLVLRGHGGDPARPQGAGGRDRRRDGPSRHRPRGRDGAVPTLHGGEPQDPQGREHRRSVRPAWALVDTNVYIDEWRYGRHSEAIAALAQGFVVRHSAVVLSELRR